MRGKEREREREREREGEGEGEGVLKNPQFQSVDEKLNNHYKTKTTMRKADEKA